MGMYKKAKALGRKAVQAVKKRYQAKPGGRKSTGGVRVAKMAKDIMYLKSVLNPEKKRIEYKGFTQNPETPTINSLQVGQINGNGDGGFFEDITPLIAQGVTASTRNGASVKLHSSIWHFQFVQQSATLCKTKLMVEIWAIEKEPYAPSTFTWRNEHWLPNPFITGGGDVRDYNTQVNPDNYMKGRCIARRRIVIPTDSLGNEKLVTDLKIPINYNKGKGRHIRYAKDTNVVEHGQMYLVIRADRGNLSNVNNSTLVGVPDLVVNTGVNFNYNVMHYYYDN